MAEGGFDPFEGKTVDPDETTDETTDFVTPNVSTSTSGEFNTGITSSTPITNKDVEFIKNSLKQSKIEEFYKHLGVEVDISFIKLEEDNFVIYRNNESKIDILYYKKGDKFIQLTNKRNGEFLSKNTLKKEFGGFVAMRNNLK